MSTDMLLSNSTLIFYSCSFHMKNLRTGSAHRVSSKSDNRQSQVENVAPCLVIVADLTTQFMEHQP